MSKKEYPCQTHKENEGVIQYETFLIRNEHLAIAGKGTVRLKSLFNQGF